MSISKYVKSSVAMLAVSALALSACSSDSDSDSGEGGSGETYNLRMSTQLADSSPMVEGFHAWADAVEERTDGAVTIEIFTSAALGSDEDVIEQAIQGVNVAVLTDGGRMGNYVADVGIIGMPYIADNYDEVLAITQTETFASWDADFADDGIKILSYNWYDGPRNFFTNKVVNTPEDLKGLQIRTPGAPVWAESVAALGATPIAMPWPDSYNAIQSGTIDGVEVQMTSAEPAALWEVTSNMARTEHFQLANFIMVGTKWFDTLPAEYQDILVEESRKAAETNAREIVEVAGELEQTMVDNGLVVNDVDKELFKEAAEAAYEKLGFVELRDQLWEEIGKN